jgi:hypothetical protein
VQHVYCTSLIKIRIGLYTYNRLNSSISKFESSMFTILIFEFVNHGYNKINMDIIVLTCYYQAWKKLQKSENPYCTQLTSCLRLAACCTTQQPVPFHKRSDSYNVRTWTLSIEELRIYWTSKFKAIDAMCTMHTTIVPQSIGVSMIASLECIVGASWRWHVGDNKRSWRTNYAHQRYWWLLHWRWRWEDTAKVVIEMKKKKQLHPNESRI